MIGYTLSRCFFIVWLKCLHSLKVYGRENLPKKGPFICAGNHVSLGDPPVMGIACNTAQLHFLAKKDLFEGKPWGWWFKWLKCIPISRDKKDYRAARLSLKLLKEGKCLGVFPEGRRSETGASKDPEVGIGFLAHKSKVPVIPMFISGTDRGLSIKSRYIVGAPVRAYIGKAVDFAGIEKISDKREKYIFISNKIMDAILELQHLTVTVISNEDSGI